MNILEYNPINVLNEVDKLFSSMFNLENRRYDLIPAVEIIEKKDKYILKAELPGIDKNDISIEIDENNVLTISGVKKEEIEENKKEEGYYYSERVYGEFKRSFQLADDINIEKIEAEFKDGVLTIILPKKEEKKSKKITLKTK